MVSEEIKDAIRGHYQAGRGSIQDYARIYRLSVEEVLEITGDTQLMSVHTIGDQVDTSDVGRNNGDVIRGPQEHDVPFDLT